MDHEHGRVWQCACGRLAIAACQRCGKTLCNAHVSELPPAPSGVSADALGHWILAVRSTNGAICRSCRAEVGNHALQRVYNTPRASLPNHWLDRAIALSGDHSRSEEEKRADAGLPPSLAPADVAREFLRRIEKPPCEQVPIGPISRLRGPDYVSGWSVACRRTQYSPVGGGGRYALPCLISVEGELLGPLLEGGTRSEAWWVVPDADIELPLLVTAVAQILILSAFVRDSPRIA